MTDREMCLIVWSFVAGVAFTLLVLRVRELRRNRAEVLRKYDAWAAAVVAQCRRQEQPRSLVAAWDVVNHVGGPYDGATLSWPVGALRYAVPSGALRSCSCYRREPGASTAKFVAVLSADEARQWAGREGSAT